jgi:multimeric flavodoxin WrbA
MKVLTITGSPRANGNTFKAVKLIENRIKEKDSSIEFEHIQLSKFNLQPCRGCFL